MILWKVWTRSELHGRVYNWPGNLQEFIKRRLVVRGPWSVVRSPWSNGQWSMASGQWSVVSGQFSGGPLTRQAQADKLTVYIGHRTTNYGPRTTDHGLRTTDY